MAETNDYTFTRRIELRAKRGGKKDVFEAGKSYPLSATEVKYLKKEGCEDYFARTPIQPQDDEEEEEDGGGEES